MRPQPRVKARRQEKKRKEAQKQCCTPRKKYSPGAICRDQVPRKKEQKGLERARYSSTPGSRMSPLSPLVRTVGPGV
jgi:hypothetical protein